ncbi:MAG: NADP-dependent oxidoreductase [Chloroflexota bacterium]
MKAIRIHKQDETNVLVYEDVPQPQPSENEVLVRVYATSVTPAELGWGATWKTKAGIERPFPIPGHELSGIIAQIGANVTDLKVGQAVYGFNDFDQDGSEAEYTIVQPEELAPKPASLTHVQAAAVPLAALTAWQALFDHAKLSIGQTVLIHGAAGGVGSFAVQLARWAKAHVVGVDAPWNRGLLLELGCDEVVDFTTTRFEDVVHSADVVLDAVGVGDAMDRSWAITKKGGVLISLAKPLSQEKAAAYGVQALFFVVSSNPSELSQIGQLIDDGQVRPLISQVLPLSQASEAYERKKGGRTPGKIVLQVMS